jgi:hypothetical protein
MNLQYFVVINTSWSPARARVTRMSIVEYWREQTHGDAFNVKWAHNVNSLQKLVQELQGEVVWEVVLNEIPDEQTRFVIDRC